MSETYFRGVFVPLKYPVLTVTLSYEQYLKLRQKLMNNLLDDLNSKN